MNDLAAGDETETETGTAAEAALQLLFVEIFVAAEMPLNDPNNTLVVALASKGDKAVRDAIVFERERA